MCYVCVYDCVCDMCEQDTQSAALIAQLAEEEKAEREERKLRQELQDVYEIKSMLRIRESQGNIDSNHDDQSMCVCSCLVPVVKLKVLASSICYSFDGTACCGLLLASSYALTCLLLAARVDFAFTQASGLISMSIISY